MLLGGPDTPTDHALAAAPALVLLTAPLGRGGGGGGGRVFLKGGGDPGGLWGGPPPPQETLSC